MATMAVASSTPSWSSVLFFKVWWYIPIDFGDFLYVWEKLPGQPNIIIYNYLAWTTKTLNKHHLTSCFFEHVFFSRSSRSEFISETWQFKTLRRICKPMFFFVLLEVNIILGLRTKTNLRTSILKEMFQTLRATSNKKSQSVHILWTFLFVDYWPSSKISRWCFTLHPSNILLEFQLAQWLEPKYGCERNPDKTGLVVV